MISGGDPLAATDSRLEMIVARLRSIPHIEIVRIGTRMPVVMPQRITGELLAMLRQYHPIWINTHSNHPLELSTLATRAAMEKIADAGIPSGNQTVLLKGVNDCPVVMRKLVHALLKVRCRPYYLYACDLSEGLGHFRSTVETGVAIIQALRGHTTGFAVPTFVIDAPGGGGKFPSVQITLRKKKTTPIRCATLRGNASNTMREKLTLFRKPLTTLFVRRITARLTVGPPHGGGRPVLKRTRQKSMT